MLNEKYIIIQLSEVKYIKELLKEYIPKEKIPEKIIDRFENETGADIEDIATQLKKLPLCAACKIESQEDSCRSLDAQKLGRRLYRLINRAHYIIHTE